MPAAAAGRRRILVLASTYPRWPGDAEPGFVHELCRRLAARFEVTVLAPDAPGALAGALDGVEVARFRYAPRRWQTLVAGGGIVANLRRQPWKALLLPGFVLGQWLAARRLLRAQRFDAVHAHWLVPQGLVARALRAHAPYVVTSHGGDLFGLRGRAFEALKRAVARHAAGMTVVSTAMRDEAQRLRLAPARLAVLPMGVDLQRRFVADAGVAREPERLLFVGRLVAKKGLRHLLDALPAIRARRPRVTLEVVGYGPEEPALRAQAAQLGLDDAVRFLGPRPQQDLPEFYRRAALLVAPFVRDASGDQEGLPVVLMEAAACGCPVLAGDVAGIDDLLGPAAGEATVPAADVAALAAAVLRRLDDPAAAAASAARIRAFASGRFDWERIAAAYGDFIEACVAAARSGAGQAP
jgi:glycosyltransferase involved in cell wall biosynthesis